MSPTGLDPTRTNGAETDVFSGILGTRTISLGETIDATVADLMVLMGSCVDLGVTTVADMLVSMDSCVDLGVPPASNAVERGDAHTLIGAFVSD